MYKKPNNPKTDQVSEKLVESAAQRKNNLHLTNFELWLEIELAELEAKFVSFATTKSNRSFFQR